MDASALSGTVWAWPADRWTFGLPKRALRIASRCQFAKGEGLNPGGAKRRPNGHFSKGEELKEGRKVQAARAWGKACPEEIGFWYNNFQNNSRSIDRPFDPAFRLHLPAKRFAMSSAIAGEGSVLCKAACRFCQRGASTRTQSTSPICWSRVPKGTPKKVLGLRPSGA